MNLSVRYCCNSHSRKISTLNTQQRIAQFVTQIRIKISCNNSNPKSTITTNWVNYSWFIKFPLSLINFFRHINRRGPLGWKLDVLVFGTNCLELNSFHSLGRAKHRWWIEYLRDYFIFEVFWKSCDNKYDSRWWKGVFLPQMLISNLLRVYPSFGSAERRCFSIRTLLLGNISR